jgi:hypothetical protein
MSECNRKTCKLSGESIPELGDGEPSPPEISDEFVAAVEDEIGMGSGAWDMIHPDAICRAVIKVFQDRRSGAAQEVSPHQYISTACLHGQHEKCRRFCKYCKVPCACKGCAHVEEVSPPSPEPRETDGHPVGWCCKHCYDGGYQAAMRLRAEGDTRELKAAANTLIDYCIAHDWGMMPEPYDSINPLLKLLGRFTERK